MRTLLREGKPEAARARWESVCGLTKLLFAEPSPAAAKYWLARTGLIESAEVRLPMGEVSEERAEGIAESAPAAAALPLVWVADSFTERANSWARDRGPMTLLSQSSGPVDDEERRRIDRFVAILGRQSE